MINVFIRVVLRLASWLAPDDVRSEWREEWDTELVWARHDGRSNAALAQRVIGAAWHAAWLRLDRWRWDMWSQDIRNGARSLAAQPGFAAVAILSLAIGIGANVAIFSAVRAVLLKPLPFPNAEALVALSTTTVAAADAVGGSSSPSDFVDWQRDAKTFDALAALNGGTFALTGDAPGEQVPGAYVTGRFFDVLGVPAAFGRTLSTDDDSPAQAEVVVLSDALWRRRYAADPGVIGRVITVDSAPYRVVGVMPARFRYPLDAELWTPLRFTPKQVATQRGAVYLDVIGRLRGARPISAALADSRLEMRGIAERLAAAFPNSNGKRRVGVFPLRDALVGDVRRPFLILLASVGCVLLIVCVNVANLSLARALGRQREFAVRTALGASRWRLARSLLVESLLLSGVGGACGLVVATWLARVIASLDDSLGIPLIDQTSIDGGVLVFALAVSLAAALLAGTLPGWQASARLDLAKRIRDDGTNTTADGRRQRLRGIMIVAETSLAVVLLVGAGLLIRSFLGLAAVDLGFERARVQTFNVSLPPLSYATPAARASFAEALIERVSAEAGVEAAGVVAGLPLTGYNYFISVATLDGRAPNDSADNGPSVQLRVASPAYFRAMGIPIARGRSLAVTDRLGAPRAIVISKAAAQLLFPGQDPLGHTVELSTRMGQGGERAGGTVVGVADDVRDFGPGRAVRPSIYIAHAQFPVDGFSVVARARTDASSLVEPMRKILASMDDAVPMYGVRSMDERSAAVLAQPRLYFILLTMFAVAALLLSAVGIYGVMAHTVGQRTREIGLRLALGADRGQVQRLVVWQAMRFALLGLVIGLACASTAGQSMKSLLFGVQAVDVVTDLVVATCFVVVALAAAWIPARRAARVDPLIALRAN